MITEGPFEDGLLSWSPTGPFLQCSSVEPIVGKLGVANSRTAQSSELRASGFSGYMELMDRRKTYIFFASKLMAIKAKL